MIMKKTTCLLLSLILVLSFSVGAVPAFGSTSTSTYDIASPKLAVMSYEGKMCADWNAVDGANSYQVAYKLSSGDKWTKEKVEGTSFTIEGNVGKDYDVKVRAIGDKANSVWTCIKNVSVRDSYTGSTNKHVMLGWQGRFTSKFWRKTSELYKEFFNPLKVQSEEASRKISLKVGQYDRCEIKRVAAAGVDESAKDQTLDVPIYSQRYDTKTGTFSFDGSWWYFDDYASEISYTLILKKDGAYTYKYFRVKYSKPEKDPSPYLLEMSDNNGLNGSSFFRSYVKANLKGKTCKIVFNGTTYTGKYKQSRNWSWSNSNIDVYTFGDYGHFYINEKTDRVCSFSRYIKKSKGSETIKSMRNKAIKFASKYIDTDEYVLKTEKADDHLFYRFERYIGDIKTAAHFSVEYTKSGKLVAFYDRSNEDIDKMLSNYSEEEMNKIISKLKSKTVRNLVLSKLKELYPDSRDEAVDEKTLVVLKNGKPGMMYKATSKEYYPLGDDRYAVTLKGEDILVSLSD